MAPRSGLDASGLLLLTLLVVSRASQEDSRADLLDEIASSLKDAPVSAKLTSLTDYRAHATREVAESTSRLRPILASLPKNLNTGRYDSPAIHYAIHHLFERQYGWHILGLDPAGSSWNASANANQVVAIKRLPEKASRLIDQRMRRGMDEREVAVLAATIEYLIHQEGRDRMARIFDLSSYPRDAVFTMTSGKAALDVYMGSLFGRENISTISRRYLTRFMSRIADVYPDWPHLQALLHQQLESTVKLLHAKKQAHLRKDPQISMTELEHAIEQVAHKWGPGIAHDECLSLKSDLLQMEDQGTGAVGLSSFYDAAIKGKWQFREHVEYMRTLGVLDEADIHNPRVLVPNWLVGASNCIGFSEFHMTCCMNECTPVQVALERGLMKPAAAPEEIEVILRGLGHDLDKVAVYRLNAIAEQHHGLVPISGRLFHQWLHHKFPRECPYPHMAGQTSPKNIKDYKGQVIMSVKDMVTEVQRPRRREAPLMAPWTLDEEVLAEPLVDSHLNAMLVVHSTVALGAFSAILVSTIRRAWKILNGQAADVKGLQSMENCAVAI